MITTFTSKTNESDALATSDFSVFSSNNFCVGEKLTSDGLGVSHANYITEIKSCKN